MNIYSVTIQKNPQVVYFKRLFKSKRSPSYKFLYNKFMGELRKLDTNPALSIRNTVKALLTLSNEEFPKSRAILDYESEHVIIHTNGNITVEAEVI